MKNKKHPYKYRVTNLQRAQAYQIEWGGVILVNDDSSYTVCMCTKIDKPCICRDRDWVNSLAPSWSEADPANQARDPRALPAQAELF